jgi:hypothetical protein
MNRNVFSEIAKEYSFLDDYETEIREKRMKPQNKTNLIENSKGVNLNENKKYFNNYSEFEAPSEEFDEEEEKKKYYGTRYGSFVYNSLDPSKMNDLDYVYKNLEVDKNVESNVEMLEKSDKTMLQDVTETIKKREIKFFAFLNKEFNVLNKKMINCSIICYSNPKMFTVNEAKLCAESCHKNIKEAGKFAEQLQEVKKEKLVNCLDKAKDYELNKADDKVASFFKCYEELLMDFDIMEKEIKSEFNNYI